MPPVIKVEYLSKAYQLGEIGTGTLSRDLERTWARIRGKEDPFLKIGEVNDRSVKGESNVVWSLKDLNFEIQQGDAVGVIGRNGAGKSTLLKILSRVTAPTKGSVKLKGRVASLLEVGTGFHPELTGKENIFLNGAILGMRNAEIKRKFDEIVDFSGVERYVDTPVKRYSSGMYVRLAFAVAAHLESEIMIIDEVLAVGDAEFQKKCLGKIGDVSKGEGRTVLFVSHNMGAIQSLCNKSIRLSNGQLTDFENTNLVIQKYLADKTNLSDLHQKFGNDTITLDSITLLNNHQSEAENFLLGDTAFLELVINFKKSAQNIEIGINIKNIYDDLISHITNLDNKFKISGQQAEKKILRIQIDKLNFTPGQYKLDVFVLNGGEVVESNLECVYFFIDSSEKAGRPGGFPPHVKVFSDTDWKLYDF